jgi:hypothetical protein
MRRAFFFLSTSKVITKFSRSFRHIRTATPISSRHDNKVEKEQNILGYFVNGTLSSRLYIEASGVVMG